MSGVPVVFDAGVLARAGTGWNRSGRMWSSPPPTSDDPDADCLGIIADAAEFSLWLSPALLADVAQLTTDPRYLIELEMLARASGGGVALPPEPDPDAAGWPPGSVLDLAAEVGAFVIVSDEKDLLGLSPYQGTAILEPWRFAEKVDQARRHARRNR
jgi:hypothetical protein